MTMYIFIDDHRKPGEVSWTSLPKLPEGKQWEIVRSYEDFQWLLLQSPDEIIHISFDHDLGWGHGKSDHKEMTGLDCAKKLVEWCEDEGRQLPAFTVHSLNPAGRENILRYLEGYRSWKNDPRNIA